MHHSTSIQTESHSTTKQKWQEPAILVERSLMVNAQGTWATSGAGIWSFKHHSLLG